MNQNQKGIANIIVIGIIVAILLGVAGYFVLVKQPTAPTQTQQLLPSKEVTTPTPSTEKGGAGGSGLFATEKIVIVDPEPGKVWFLGQKYNIVWTFNDNNRPLRIDLIKDGTVVDTIAQDVKGVGIAPGSILWRVPSSLPISDSYEIYIYPSDGRELLGKSGKFSIHSSGISVLSPNGGEQWIIGEKHFIRWNGATTVSIGLKDKEDSLLGWIFTGTSLNQSFEWDTRTLNLVRAGGGATRELQAGEYRIWITDSVSAVSDPGNHDESDQLFFIK
jgi:hypothetical protein